MLSFLDAVATALAALSVYWIADRQGRKRIHLPPGPKGLPIIGNALQIPRGKEHTTFLEMGTAQGSDLVTLKIPGHTFIVINSREAIADLFEGRSANYSDRPHVVMAKELAGWSGSIVLSNNTPRFRTCRKFLRKGLGTTAVQSFIPYLQRQSPFLLEELVKDPNNYDEIIKRATARISMKIAYGYDGVDSDDELFDLTVEANHNFDETAVFGVWMVDLLPVLKHIPSWFPGASFKRYAARAYDVTTRVINKPFDEVKKRIQQGTADGSFSSMLLQAEQGDAENEDCIKWSAGGIFMGQMDTSTATLSWFLLAMALHPDVQAKAQAELDSVVGSERLTQISDCDSLPYVMAVMREVFRWKPIIGLIPRAVTNDDEYRGYFIPAKTTVIANVWAVLQDESVYPQADKFIPERFLDPDVPDSLNAAFGFGRRICPGMLIAQSNVFLTMATILSTLNISKAKDTSGNVIEPIVEGISGFVNFPKPFKVSIVPRSTAALDLIRQSTEHSRTLPDKLEVFRLDS